MIKNLFRRFIKEEDGMELLQVAIIVLVAVALAIAVWRLAARVEAQVNDAANAIDNIAPSIGE